MRMREPRVPVPVFLPPIPRRGAIIGVSGGPTMLGPDGDVLVVTCVEPSWRADTRAPTGWVFEHVHMTGTWQGADGRWSERRSPVILLGPALGGLPTWVRVMVQTNWPEGAT